MKILVIEDSKFLRHAVERGLAKAGYIVKTAGDGVQGVQAVRETIPDLILLDMMLPGLSGLEVLQQLKQEASTASIPVIVLTALSERNREKLLNDGASAYVEKSDKLLENNCAALADAILRVIGKTKAAKA